MSRPRAKGLRKHHLKQFASNNIAIKGRIDQTKMAEDQWFGYTERAATIGAKEAHKLSTSISLEPVVDGEKTYLVPVRRLHMEHAKVDDIDGQPHKTLYTRGKNNELNSSIPRVWTIAKLYQGHLRQQQQVRYTPLVFHRYANGGIWMFYSSDSCFFVEIDDDRKINRCSKMYSNVVRAKHVYAIGRIKWINR